MTAEPKQSFQNVQFKKLQTVQGIVESVCVGGGGSREGSKISKLFWNAGIKIKS